VNSLALDRIQQWPLVNMIMNFHFPQNVGNLPSLKTISFWRSLYHEVYFITYSVKTLTLIFPVPLGYSSIRSLTLFTLTQSDTVLVLQQILVNDLLEMPTKTPLNSSQPRNPLSEETLLIIAMLLTYYHWGFNYDRQAEFYALYVPILHLAKREGKHLLENMKSIH
jgi:hypothetical protein